MKRFLLFSVLSIFCLTISAQNFEFTGNGDGTTWHDPNNWNPPQVPGNIFNEVTIPTGKTVTNEGTIIFNFGNIVGGGTLINNSVFSFSGAQALSRVINNISIINNATLLSEVPNNPTYISGGATITNTATGTITFDGLGMTSGSTDDKIINNGGTIRNINPGNLSLGVILENNNGTISVENGFLSWATGANSDFNYLQDGIYNVAQDATFWLGDFTLGGTFNGQIDGAFGLVGTGNNIFKVIGTLTNNLGGNGLTFYFGSLEGGGTIINNSKFNITNDGGGLGKVIKNLTIINNAEFNSVLSANNTSWGLWDGSEIINESTGIMNIGLGFNANTGAETLQNNGGTINITNDVGLGVNFTNSGMFNYGPNHVTFSIGVVSINNTIDGTFLGTGQLDLNAGELMINHGLFSSGPGANKIFIYNGYRQDANARLEVDLNGNNPETEYDVIEADYGGPFDMNGTIIVNLGFAPALDDEFTVLFSVNRTVVCGLPATVTAHYDNHDYTFDVICEGSSITLKVTNILLGTEEHSLSNLSMYPNPSNGHFIIELGKEYSGVGVQIYNMLGQQISSNRYASAKRIEQEINASAGIYFVKVSTAKEGSNTLRIIKK